MNITEIKETNKELLTTLINELKAVHAVMGKSSSDDSKMWMQYPDSNGDGYTIITKDKEVYILSCSSTEFPNIDFSEIIYVRKHFQTPVLSDTGKSVSYLDSIIGYFNLSDDYSYPSQVLKHFSII